MASELPHMLHPFDTGPTGIPMFNIHCIPSGEELVETGHADAKFRSFYQPCGSQAKTD